MIGFTGCYLLISTSRSVGALTFLIGAITVFVIFGLRWFRYGANPFAATSWPPVINTCPDYLVFYNRMTATGTEPSCVDVMGVSTKGTVMAKWPTEGPPPPEDKYYFSLKFNNTSGTALLAEKCNRTIEKGLTWEGISNGESCYNWTKNGAAAGGASGSGACVSG